MLFFLHHHEPATEQKMTILFGPDSQIVDSSKTPKMDRCIPKEAQTLSSFGTAWLCIYKLQYPIPAGTTHALSYSWYFLTKVPQSAKENNRKMLLLKAG